jgi:sigma-B regulation protein RsbU (phosphoserine phosphatase)
MHRCARKWWLAHLRGLAVVAGLALSPLLHAQPTVFDASHLHGISTLKTQWLVHAGDDPAYAQPDFDDSQWTFFDPSGSLKAIYGRTKPSIVWYRLRVKVDPGQADLALDESNLSYAFEIYVDGERLIASGSVAPSRPYTGTAHLRASIPARFMASGMLVLAMRVYLAPIEWSRGGQNPGYYVSNLTLGSAPVLYRDDFLSIIGDHWLLWIEDLLFLALGIVALVLFSAQRSQPEYLWIVAASILQIAELPESVIPAFTNIPLAWEFLFAVPYFFSPWVLGSLYFSFVHQKIGWRWRSYFLVAGIPNAFGLLQYWMPGLAVQQLFLNLPFVLLLAAIIPAVLAYHWRRGNREAGILLIPVMLSSLFFYLYLLGAIMFEFRAWRSAGVRVIEAITIFPLGPMSVDLGTVTDILSIVALGVIILLRSTRMSLRQAQIDAELEAAQQVQQMLVPEMTSSVQGFAVDAVYLPAQQVGGDFFQVLPAGDGGLLVVIGDVAGKGLPAAMMVSALVGSIRTAADDTHAPEALLQRLNDRLVGRTGGGFTTALAAYISPNGTATFANAGHLSPYLDGKEVELPGALPLGVIAATRYETRQVEFPPGGRLTLYSDGVIEAQNKQGELFGFGRGCELSRMPVAAIIEAATKFGQQDDMTVIAITREAAQAHQAAYTQAGPVMAR